MLEKTANYQNYQQREKEGLYRLLNTFDPQVSGLVFFARHLWDGLYPSIIGALDKMNGWRVPASGRPHLL
jgi:hypothetical protein